MKILRIRTRNGTGGGAGPAAAKYSDYVFVSLVYRKAGGANGEQIHVAEHLWHIADSLATGAISAGASWMAT